MTLSEQIRIQKEAGHSSKVCLPISVLEGLIRKADAYDNLPDVIKDAGKKLQEAGQ